MKLKMFVFGWEWLTFVFFLRLWSCSVKARGFLPTVLSCSSLLAQMLVLFVAYDTYKCECISGLQKRLLGCITSFTNLQLITGLWFTERWCQRHRNQMKKLYRRLDNKKSSCIPKCSFTKKQPNKKKLLLDKNWQEGCRFRFLHTVQLQRGESCTL